MKFGLLGSGSWGTALAKVLTDNKHTIGWWMRDDENITSFKLRRRNPHYLRNAKFDTNLIQFSAHPEEVISNSDVILIVVPSAFVKDALRNLNKNVFKGKKILSAVKGIIPDQNILLNEFLAEKFGFKLENYFTVLGPCHAEEVAAEKLSYLTFSGVDKKMTEEISTHFTTPYMRTIQNSDVFGAQYASVLKNIYAIGAGIAHGLGYGDNFQSVFIANSADEMAGFLRKHGQYVQVGRIEDRLATKNKGRAVTNYAASVYLGDLLVTCYSLYSRNRSFGNMIGQGYSVRSAQLEMKMIAEGYFASKCIHAINEDIEAEIPIAETIYQILWKSLRSDEGFKKIENVLI